MPFLTTRRFLLPASTLLLTVCANAQTCYYPDGKTISSDIPCDPSSSDSSCCGSDSFCLADGLCYGNGLVTRGSCTDQTWSSSACAAVCTTVEQSTEIAISPCTSGGSSNTFACGAGTNVCGNSKNTFTISDDAGLVLRPNQIAQLVGSAVQSAAPSSASSTSSSGFTAAALAGVAIGVAVPLIIALIVMYALLRREKNRWSKPNLMYKLPDEVTREDFTFTPPPPVRGSPFASNRSSQTTNATATSTIASRRNSRHTLGSLQTPKPFASQSFMERYETMKKNSQAQVASREVSSQVSIPSPRAELDSPTKEVLRYELSESRMSK